MYSYPFLLMTMDDIRNASLADMFEDELLDTLKWKTEFYESLPESFPKRALHDLKEIEATITKILLEIFRSHMNILSTKLPAIDVYRVREKLKRLLIMMRRKGVEIMHEYDTEYTFADTVRKLDKWEEHESMRGDNVSDANSVFLNRVSDIHHHLSRLVENMEPRLLIFSQVSSLPEEQANHALEHVSNLTSSTDISKIAEVCRILYKEIKEYIRLVDSL
jgi:cob(I)alamin adenosyltransferase